MITKEEWLKAWHEASIPSDTATTDALTARELSELLGVSLRYAYLFADELLRQRKVIVVKRHITGRRAGGPRYVNAYKLIAP